MMDLYPIFKLDALNSFIVMAIGLFTLFALIYSSKFMKARKGGITYYTYIILTAVASMGAVLANNLIWLLAFWGFLGLTLYLLINMGEDASLIAKKTFIIVGGTDALMLAGVTLIYHLTGTYQMDAVHIEVNNGLAVLAYLCIACAAFAKAGAMPLHSWVPECASKAPIPVTAYLPASLDKLLGIYLLARISLNMFQMNTAMNTFLMIVGAGTIIAAVMMALVQHNMKKLLGFSTVSQVGYMVLGIGTGNPVGIAGGIFHMLNHSVYKQALFMVAGNVEKQAGTTELDKLGGLSRVMPITYICMLIASFSISGVPPFNGFVSKWMVYQGLISQMASPGYVVRATAAICLVAAMFGSALTLASFMKLIHAMFLGQGLKTKLHSVKEVSWQMWSPALMLGLICILFGVFAYQVPLRYFILPAVSGVVFAGAWRGLFATALILAGLLLGLLIFRIRWFKPVLRRDAPFVGAEDLELGYTRLTGIEFYNSVREIGFIDKIYAKADAGIFDIYEQGKNLVFSIGRFLQYLHNGVLPTYLVWTLLGMMGLFWALLR